MKKKSLLLIIASVFVLCFAYCGKKGASEGSESSSGFSAADTTAVLDQTKVCMEELKAGEIEKALDKIYYLKQDGELVKLSDDQKVELAQRFENFPVLSYKLQSFSFDPDGVSTVKYMTEFFENKPGEKLPNTLAVVFNCVKKDNEWCLAFKNSH